jgi:hypothetical protein
MKNLLLALFAINSLSSAFAQKEVKYVKMYYKNTSIENTDLIISVENAVSTDAETKFKLKIVNLTPDYIMFKPDECKFIIGGKELKPSEKSKTIDPNSSDWLVVNMKGTGYNSVKSYSFEIGGLYKVSTSGQAIETPDFKLPASKNEFKTGKYSLVLTKLSKETDKTEAKFDCAYNGDKIGLVFPSKIGVKMPDGNEYASLRPKGIMAKKGAILLTKGQTESFTAVWERMQGGKATDMQKVEMLIKWNDTFTEVTPEKLKNETLILEFDEKLSNEKGK